MKEVLEQLLRAEEEGRRLAASREAEGRRLVEQAEAESRQVEERARLELSHRIEALRAEVRADTDERLRALTEESERTIGWCRDQSERRRAEAVRQLVAMLLDESPASRAAADTGPGGPADR